MGVSDHTKPTMKSMADMVVMGNLMSKVTRKSKITLHEETRISRRSFGIERRNNAGKGYGNGLEFSTDIKSSLSSTGLQGSKENSCNPPKNINQSDVIEEEADGSDDGSDDESKYHDTEDADENLNVVNVDIHELFFDLIFVSMAIKLASYIKADFGWSAVLSASLLFAYFWFTWYHVNMIKTRFRIPDKMPYSAAVFLIMLFTLMSMQPVDPVEPWFQDTGCLVLMALNRLAFIVLNCSIMFDIPKSRVVVKRYTVCFALSMCLNLISAFGVGEDRTLRSALMLIALVVELVMYPAGVVWVSKEFVLDSINVGHHLERTELWAILILGESIISLVTAEDFVPDVNFFGTVVVAFTITFLMMWLFIWSQPLHHSGFDTHAYDLSPWRSLAFNLTQLLITLGFFGMGVGLKFVCYYGVGTSPDNYKTEYALLFSVAAGWSCFWIQISRFCHEWSRYHIIGMYYGRYVVWAFNTLLSLAIPFLGLLVESSSSNRRRELLQVLEEVVAGNTSQSILVGIDEPINHTRSCELLQNAGIGRSQLDAVSLSRMNSLNERKRRGGGSNKAAEGFTTAQFLAIVLAFLLLLVIAEMLLRPDDQVKTEFAEFIEKEEEEWRVSLGNLENLDDVVCRPKSGQPRPKTGNRQVKATINTDRHRETVETHHDRTGPLGPGHYESPHHIVKRKGRARIQDEEHGLHHIHQHGTVHNEGSHQREKTKGRNLKESPWHHVRLAKTKLSIANEIRRSIAASFGATEETNLVRKRRSNRKSFIASSHR